jgi:hypothetical protein
MVAKSLYYSHIVNQSDSDPARNYAVDVEGNGFAAVMHVGSYFDPGMEFGEKFGDLSKLTIEEIEKEFDAPFKSQEIPKIIKSHSFAYQLDFIKENWPDCPIIMCLRSDKDCHAWWKKAGGFKIEYPNYKNYIDDDTMAENIAKQNSGIKKFMSENPTEFFQISNDLVRRLGLQSDDLKTHDYTKQDVQVYLYWSNT